MKQHRRPSWTTVLVLAAALFRPGGILQAQEPASTTEVLLPVIPPGEVPATQLLKTNDLAFVPKGTIRVGLSADYLKEVELPFSGLAGDLWQFGVLRVDIGFSDRVEVQVRGIVRQSLSVDEGRSTPVPPVTVSSGTTHDVGDFTATTLVRVMDEKVWWPAVGFRVEAKLPNTDEAKGIGTNSTDVIVTALLQKRFGDLTVFSDVGIGILTEPTLLRSQNDVLEYGLAAKYLVSRHIMFMGEVNGRWAPSGYLPGTEDHSQLRGGLAWRQGGLTCEFLLTKGLTHYDEQWGAAFGLSFGFPVFKRVRPG